MTRIISGSAGGRRLRTPPGSSTRPTSDRVREALFSRLEHRGLLDDTRVLDLYAGSGALGLEAASRGAADVVLVESQRGAATAIRANIAAVGHPSVRLVADTVERALARRPSRRHALRPRPARPALRPDGGGPRGRADRARRAGLARTARPSSSSSGRPARRSPGGPPGLELSGEKRYGETAMWFAEPTTDDVVA